MPRRRAPPPSRAGWCVCAEPSRPTFLIHPYHDKECPRAYTPHHPRRSVGIDKDTGLISDEHYEVMPTAYIVQRYGSSPGKVALTFDDGPDPRWTPRIAAALRRLRVPATFFVVGANVARHPELVAALHRDGFELGSHTFTHADVTLTFAMLDMQMSNQDYRLVETRPGIYNRQASTLLMAGNWALSFTITPKGAPPFTALVVDHADG